MKKKALRKDFYMEIRKSLGRFLSIFFIVALGVSFFSGIRATEPDMRLSGDAYFDRHHLADMRVISTFGLTKEDIAALKKTKGVEKAEYGYSIDAISKSSDSKKVLHIMSALPTLNQVDVLEGRFPEKENECFVDIDFLKASKYQVGDTIELESGTEDSLKDSLKTDSFTITGAGSSPCYISFERGSSMIGTGAVSGYMIVPEETFSMDVYTECYLTVTGALEETAYTNQYQSKVEAVVENVEAIKGARCQIRREEVVKEAEEEFSKAEKELTDAKKETKKELDDALKKLKDGEKKLADGKRKTADGKKALASAKAQLSVKKKELDKAKKQTDDGFRELKTGQEKYAAAKAEFQEKRTKAQAGIEKLQAGAKELESGIAQVEAQMAQVENVLQNPELTEPEKTAYQETLVKLGAQKEELSGKLTALNSEKQKISDELLKGSRQIEAAGKELTQNEIKLKNAKEQIASGQKQLQAGEKELKSKEQELLKAERKLEDSAQELTDGWSDYESGKEEAEEKIAEGEQKLTDARKEIAEIGTPKWYVDDREAFPEYAGLGDNADRIKAIGKVFPVIFFLVAALISLTTMTRMVEEQRTQIGTLKALGYSKISIAGKYLDYALIATLGGSVAGVLIGEKIYPYIIIHAYQIMYKHLPDIVIPYNMQYALLATLAAVVCTMFATVVSCYKEMASQPAVLMRPPTPKQGKRVFLERLTFIWKHLSFTWKSTIRNLVRYKKRFFMTVFGIGGCMALILVGYGIKDSISSIGAIQFEKIQRYNLLALTDENASKEEEAALEKYVDSETQISDDMDVYMKNTTIGKGKLKKEAYVYVPKEKDKFREFVTLENRRTKEKYELTDEGAILSEKMAKTLKVEAGDMIYLENDENEKVQVKVVNICENYLGHYLYLTADTYKSLYGEPPVYNSRLFKIKDYDEKRASEIGENMLATKSVVNVQYMSNQKARIEDMLGALDSVIVVLIAAAGMLAFVVLYNLNNINITERKRELATIKVLGFYDMEVAEYVYRENIILTLVGSVVGLVLGYFLHQFIIVTVEINDVMFGRNIEPKSYLIGFLFTVGFSAFVNWIMYFKLKKINMVESLKSVE